MLNTLYARLAAVLVILLLAIGIIYGVVSTATVERYLVELTQHFNRDLARRIVADRNLVAEGRLDKEALKSTFGAYMDINPSIEIYLLDLDGNIVSYSADPQRVKRNRIDLKPVQAFLAGEGFPLLGDDPRSHERRKAFSVTPVPSADAAEGYLYVVLQGEQYDMAEQAVQESYVLRLSAWAVAAGLGFGLLSGLLLFHLMTRRLRRLSSGMRAFQESGFTEPLSDSVPTDSAGDEVAQLGHTFARMSDRIVSQMEALREQDQLRRNLIAQISHDLRTPLAATHGYLETLSMEDEMLDPARRKEYLAIALRQSESLRRMIEQLFELAHLEAKEVTPLRESFSIGELLHDVARKFRLRADKGGFALKVGEMRGAPMVEGDIALTERILDNLIGNALAYTPEKGEIALALEAFEERVQVSVTNTGRPIPPEELPRIFEPFYRGAGGRSTAGKGGLGLAIAKRMSELQGGDLAVENSSDGRVRFCFSLPIAFSESNS